MSILCQCLSVYELSTPTSLFFPKVNPIFCWLETQVRGNLSSSSMQLRLCHALCLQQELDLQVQVCASSAVTGYLFTQVGLYRNLLCMWTYVLRLLWAQLKQRTAVEARDLIWLCSPAPLSVSMKDCDDLLAGNLTSLIQRYLSMLC